MKPLEQPDRRGLRAAAGNWDAHDVSMERMHAAAAEWCEALEGIERPWLCWSVDSDWSLVQQRLVSSVGWTPVVGFDPRAGAPSLHQDAVLLDFNRLLSLPSMRMMYPLEWVFLFAPRLAFWHSDLLVRLPVLERLAREFAELKDGEMAAVDCRTHLFNRLRGRYGRYWELIGCTTRGASAQQFEHGAGWWRHINSHINCPSGAREKAMRQRYSYDHGAGILYWAKNYRGTVRPIPEKLVDEGHCTRINNPQYVPASPGDERRNLSKDLSSNYSLTEVCGRLGLTRFLAD